VFTSDNMLVESSVSSIDLCAICSRGPLDEHDQHETALSPDEEAAVRFLAANKDLSSLKPPLVSPITVLFNDLEGVTKVRFTEMLLHMLVQGPAGRGIEERGDQLEWNHLTSH
jgi:hypothetical protein